MTTNIASARFTGSPEKRQHDGSFVVFIFLENEILHNHQEVQVKHCVNGPLAE